MTSFHTEIIENLNAMNTSRLAEESVATGFRHIVRLIEEYVSGINQFDKPGELLIGAFNSHETLVGICGLNQEPYNLGERLGRVRRLYVMQDYRRQGIARELMNEVMKKAQKHYSGVVLKTDNEGADRFYKSLGFSAANQYKNVSHYKKFDEED